MSDDDDDAAGDARRRQWHPMSFAASTARMALAVDLPFTNR